MASTASTATQQEVTLRPAEAADTDELARIVFEAFGDIHDHHRFPRDFPALEAAAAMMGAWVPHPAVWGVVAEVDGTIVGSNFLDERDPIRGVGPITIDPKAQNAGVGRRLMEAVIERGKQAPGIRLLQDGFHMRSLSLYTRLGFDTKASCIVMQGEPRDEPVSGVEVRPVTEDDLEECEALCKKVHRFERTGALRDSVLHPPFTPFAALRDGRIVAYASMVDFWPMAHGVAESEQDMQALLLGAAAAVEGPIALLVPLESNLFRWGLEQRLRAVKPMNLMALGSYQEPQGAWFPSVIY
jgi:GNAT superfamily N-acetyltransferase